MSRRENISSVHHIRVGLTETSPVSGDHHLYPHAVSDFWDVHCEMEFGIVLQGKVRRFWDRYTVDMERGQAWMCGMWETHGVRIVDHPTEIVVLSVLPEMLATTRFEGASDIEWIRSFAGDPRERPQATGDARERVADIGTLMREALRDDSLTHRSLHLRLLLFQALLELSASPARGRGRTSVVGGSYEIVRRALGLVFNTRDLLTVENVAQHVGLNRTAFSERFRQVMRMGFASFALRYRVSGAARELLSTQVPLKTLAAEWGFTDSSHFIRCFRRQYGVTPDAYRRRAQDSSSVQSA